MRAARWGPPPYIPAPWAGFGASVKRKPRTGCYDPAVRQGTPATLLLPVSRIADLEPHRHFAPAFLGHPAARRRLEAPFRQRPLLRRLEQGRAVPAPQFARPDPPVGADQLGRAHVRTPVPNAQRVCRLLLEKKQ